LWRPFRLEERAFGVLIGGMEKTIALSVIVAIVVFATIYAVTILRTKRHPLG
jgi:hypothetical protein